MVRTALAALAVALAACRVRELLRARYGWRDAFVGLLQDTSRSIAVRLEPLESRF